MNTHKQKGAVLLVSLIMLVVITIIGLASMRDTTLQERMAANLRDQEASLQAAETALRAGERHLSQLFRTAAGVQKVELSTASNPVTSTASTLSTSSTLPEFRMYFVGRSLVENPVAGEPMNEGYLVRIIGEGTGSQQNASGTASSKTKINTLVLVVPDQLEDN